MCWSKQGAWLRAMVAVCAASVCVATSQAGDLDPPAGPVASTMKALDVVEPRTAVGPSTTPGDSTALYVISAPGSYYLAGDINGVAGKDGIRIDASQVTLDLNGFTVRGVAGSLAGISFDSLATACNIHGGVVMNWGEYGINGFYAFNSLMTDLQLITNTLDGMQIAEATTARSCIATGNGGDGFGCNGPVSLVGCYATGNGGDGFHMDAPVSLVNCHTVSNFGVGFMVHRGSMLNCTAAADNIAGFDLSGSVVTATNCSVSYCANGFVVLGACVLTNCSATNCEDGFQASFGARLDRCTAQNNSDDGFQLGEAAAATNCSSVYNAFGFYAPASATGVSIDSCTAISSDNDGFLIAPEAYFLSRNIARNNGTNFVAFTTTGRQVGTIYAGEGTISTDAWANFSQNSSTVTRSAEPDRVAKEAAGAAWHSSMRERWEASGHEPIGTQRPR